MLRLACRRYRPIIIPVLSDFVALFEFAVVRGKAVRTGSRRVFRLIERFLLGIEREAFALRRCVGLVIVMIILLTPGFGVAGLLESPGIFSMHRRFHTVLKGFEMVLVRLFCVAKLWCLPDGGISEA